MNKPIDPNKLKATPIKRASDTLPALKPAPKLPAKTKHQWRDFDDFINTAKVLIARADGGSGKWWLWGEADTLAMIAEFNAALKFFNRDELYQRTKVMKPDFLNCHTHWQITRRVVSEQVGLLVASFPNSVTSPKVYIRMLIEEIFAANPNPIALEATCREICRTETFGSPPAVGKVLKVLREQAEWWNVASETVCCMEDDHAALQQKKLDAINNNKADAATDAP